MNPSFKFTYKNIQSQFANALKHGYHVVTCEKFVKQNQSGEIKYKTLINRIDIDFSVKKAEKLVEIFNQLKIKGTFFIRLHAKEYNPFSFENYRIIKHMIESGHEIGYHSEIIDQSAIWKENAKENLIRDIEIINKMFNIKINGVASHGGMTGLNNLDFWKNHKPREFRLLYEAYDWFNEAFYISDSEWTSWKCYDNGKLVTNDKRSLGEHILQNHRLIYSLIHSDTYFDNHFYE